MSAVARQNAILVEQLLQIARQLDGMKHNQRSQYMQQQAQRFNISKSTLYKWLKEKTGWHSGRKKRADAGKTSLTEDAIEAAAAMQKAALRKNGKHMLSTPTVLSLLQQNAIPVTVSPAHFNRVLKSRGLSQAQQALATPHCQMASLHPNHVHQVDPSLCVLYYMGGRQHMMEADKFYKNKLDNFNKVKLKVWRYVLVDHYSATIIPWYVEAAGENPENLFEFLLFAWGRQPGRDFHGVPDILVWDKGSANTAASIRNFCDSLETRHITHQAGNARAKGSVECGNNLVERLFEVRLKFQPVESIAELNAAAFAWANAYNANCLRNQDTRLHRKGMAKPRSRAEIWQQITSEQLRLLPDATVCRDFMVGKADTREVGGDMTISYKHPKLARSCQYDLTGCDGINTHQTVEVCPMIYGDGLITVTAPRYDGEDLKFKLQPIDDYNAVGFRENSPVFGAKFQAKPKTTREKDADHLDRIAYGELPEKEMQKAREKSVPFNGKLDTHEHLKHIDLPTFLPRKGREITTGQRFDEQPMTVIAAARLLKTELGSQYSSYHLQYLKQHYPEGITATDLEALAAQFKNSKTSIVQEC